MRRNIILGLILLTLIGCKKENQEWNPIFENTSFNYLNTEIERSISIIDEASSETLKDNAESMQGKLYQAKSRLLEMKDYYIPLTTVRQKIYDAERYLKLNATNDSMKQLIDSKTIIESLGMMTKNTVFDKVLLDLNSMIDEVIISLRDDAKRNTYNRMKTLGEHLNLMLYRADLILSGIDIEN
jgi:hypothetical protein